MIDIPDLRNLRVVLEEMRLEDGDALNSVEMRMAIKRVAKKLVTCRVVPNNLALLTDALEGGNLKGIAVMLATFYVIGLIEGMKQR